MNQDAFRKAWRGILLTDLIVLLAGVITYVRVGTLIGLGIATLFILGTLALYWFVHWKTKDSQRQSNGSSQ